MRIQLFIEAVEPPGSCDGIKPTALGPPTAVRLALPEPLGSRKLEDVTPDPAEAAAGRQSHETTYSRADGTPACDGRADDGTVTGSGGR